MKNVNYIISLFVLVLISISCSDDFLLDAAKPLDQPGGEDFYNTPVKVKGGIFGIYEEMYGIYERDEMYQRYENISDNGKQNQGGSDAINLFNKQLSHSPGNIWNRNFKVVSKANIMIASIEAIDGWDNDSELLRYMGEARFMRAWAYMNLVTIFGNVPKITKQPTTFDEAADLSREPVGTIFNEIIIPDLEFASDYCWLKSDIVAAGDLGAAPKGAAKILLAEAYLFVDRDSDAERIAEEVIASGEYSLVSDFADVFNGNDNNEESVFEIQYNFGATGQANEMVRLLPFDLRDATGQDIVSDVSVPSWDLVYAMANTGDTRYYTTLDSGVFDDNLGVFTRATYWRKYHDDSQIAFPITNDWNIKLLRFPDALHLAAEAEIKQNKISEAFNHLNETRMRANMPLYDANGVSQEEALAMYLHERRMEFAGEAKRWRDLLRTDQVHEYINPYLQTWHGLTGSINDFQILYPVPQSEIDANPGGITQNDGY